MNAVNELRWSSNALMEACKAFIREPLLPERREALRSAVMVNEGKTKNVMESELMKETE